MKKRIALFFSFFFVLLYLVWLFFTGIVFMPESGYQIHSRPVSEDILLVGRDNPDSRSTTRELLPGELININTADEETLQLLSGIGPALSSAIIEYRSEHGFYHTIEDLMLVPGIGEKKFAAIRDFITTGGEE